MTFQGSMIKKIFKINNQYGLHARPAALLVKTAGRYASDIRVAKDGYVVNGKSLMGVMTLAAEPGSEIEVIIDGEDEQEAMEAIEELIRKNFFEE